MTPTDSERTPEVALSGDLSAPFPILEARPYHRDGERHEITVADLDQAVENFEAAGEAPLDFDHSFASGRGSRASGWIRELVRRGPRLFARVEWTDAAREAIRRREYRYFSAEVARNLVDEDGRERGFAVVSGGLTNRPFFRGLGPVAFHARERDDDPERYLTEVEELLDAGNENFADLDLQLRAARVMDEHGLDYPAAVEAARKETEQ